MSLGHGASIVRNGLMLHLDAANVKSYSGSGTAWNDLSGNGNNVTLVNGVGYDQQSKAFIQDGINDYSYTPSIVLTDLTFSVIFRLNSLSGYQTFIHNKNGVWNGASGFYYEWRPSTKSFMLVGSGSSYVDSITIPTISTTSIQEMTVTVSGTLVSHYYNGTLLNTGSLSGSIESNTNDLYLGAFYNTASFVNCNTYKYKLYNRALNVAEIKQNFEATRGRYGI